MTAKAQLRCSYCPLPRVQCPGRVYKSGLCKRHYQRVYRTVHVRECPWCNNTGFITTYDASNPLGDRARCIHCDSWNRMMEVRDRELGHNGLE
jgi:hypothetical protein